MVVGTQQAELDTALLCHCAGLPFAFAIEHVLRASYLPAVQPLPETPEYLIGITRFAGESVPLVDLAGRLTLSGGATRYTIDTPVVWCQAGARRAGFVVDRIERVSRGRSRPQHLDTHVKGATTPFLAIINAHDSDSDWLLLDPERLLAFDMGQSVSELQIDPVAIRRALRQLELTP